jgi:hypothetical protein
MLSSYLGLGLRSGILPSGPPTKILYALLLYPICATCLSVKGVMSTEFGILLSKTANLKEVLEEKTATETK